MQNKPVKIASFLLIGIGVVLFALNIFLGGELNIALPLVFLLLGGVFYILVFAAREKWGWASILYIPGSLLLAFGLIFLLNVLTKDWNAWAYAWLLLLSGLGVGVILASRSQPWPEWANLAGWGMATAGLTFFAVFGAIAGGLFIQVMAPLLIVVFGIGLRWLHPETILPASILQRLHLLPVARGGPTAAPDQRRLVEPLSMRELEVLRLVDAGFSNQQIAEQLHVAASTVKTHINNIYGKLGVQTRLQAVNRALGLLDGKTG